MTSAFLVEFKEELLSTRPSTRRFEADFFSIEDGVLKFHSTDSGLLAVVAPGTWLLVIPIPLVAVTAPPVEVEA